jgi:glycosyltransferase involved in cell wall biosynthesis
MLPTGRAAGRPAAARRSVLIIVENLPVPFDRRVWKEARTLSEAGYAVSVICPTGKGYEARREVIDGVHIYRHPLPLEARSALGYPLEYLAALSWEFFLTWRVLLTRGFDAIHACNPPDLIFLIGGFFKLFFRKKFIFDHHDLSPELFTLKFGKNGLLLRLMLALERWTFRTADVSIATNHSFRRIAVERGGMSPDRVFIVRSGPDLEMLKVIPPQPALKHGRAWLVAYMGVMNRQDGVEYVLHAAHHIVGERGRADIQFVLLGDGPELASLKELAVELGVVEYVTFTGWTNPDVFVPYLNTADVCIGPDPWNEFNDKLTMNKIMEYMAVGKPIVQFDLAEGRFSAQDAALYAARNDAVDLAEKILQLLADPIARKEMGDRGRQRIEAELSWQHEEPRLLAAYAAVFDPHATATRKSARKHV